MVAFLLFKLGIPCYRNFTKIMISTRQNHLRLILGLTIIILEVSLQCSSFNIDIKVPIVKTTGRLNSYFGFSVAQHRINNTVTGEVSHVVLVGAPKDNITDSSSPETVLKLVRPGAVYQCPFDSHSDNCEAINVDREAPGPGIDKNDQWMGVSVSSQGTENGSALVCAHRAKRYEREFVRGLGLCISLSNTLEEEEAWDPWEPCSGRKMDGFNYELCQAGVSSSVHKNGEILIGAPGTGTWRGTVFRNSINPDLDYLWHQAVVETPRLGQGDPEPAMPGLYSYLGMSVKICRVINGHITYVAGAPRAKEIGQVLLFQKDDKKEKFLTIQPEHYLTGDLFGSQFGYEIAVADFNGDGKEDLAVGAPFYHGSGIGGAIYIFLNGPEGITFITKPLRILSRKMNDTECTQLNCQNSRFGFALASIGDVDKDGFDDLAVGAPYEGRGVVYIFRGSSIGLIKDYSQRIAASNFPLSSLPLTFGYSIAGGQDMDQNGYPDIVVGSYSSGHVHILRSCPVINLITDFVAIPSLINPRATQCLATGVQQICFELQICVQFTAYPNNRLTKPIQVKYTLFASKFSGSKVSRVQFSESASTTDQSTLTKIIAVNEQQSSSGQNCEKHLAYIPSSSKDFLNPIALQLRYTLPDNPGPSMKPGEDIPNLDSFPVLNTAHTRVALLVDFIKYCGSDSKCESSLALQTRMSIKKNQDNDYVLRVGEDLEVWIYLTVQNAGEDAHQATVFITLPESLRFVGTDEEGKKYSCSPTNAGVECSIGNPLKEGQTAAFAVRLDPSKAAPSADKHSIVVVVNTTSNELNPADNLAIMNFKIIFETDLAVKGASNPESVYYGGEIRDTKSIYFTDEIGPSVVHSYEVKNIGRASVSKSTVHFRWPYAYSDDDNPLLYLMDKPTVDGNGNCDSSKIIFNARNIQSRPRDQQSLKNDSVDTVTDPTAKKQKIGGGGVQTLDCDTLYVKCHQFHCVLGELLPGTSIVIVIRAYLWNSTFNKYFNEFNEVLIQSRAELNIDPILNILQSNTDNDISKPSTKANNALAAKESERIPIWIIIVAVLGGILLLVIIIVVFWKVGFFKRKEHDEMVQHKATMEKSTDENREEVEDEKNK